MSQIWLKPTLFLSMMSFSLSFSPKVITILRLECIFLIHVLHFYYIYGYIHKQYVR